MRKTNKLPDLPGFRMALLSGEVETLTPPEPSASAVSAFRMALLSGVVETRRMGNSTGPMAAPFRMAFLSEEVETGYRGWPRCRTTVSVPDGFAIRGS